MKKKNGEFKLCINKATISYRFVILVMEELFDELYDTVIFPRLDLKSRLSNMVEKDDIHKFTFKTHEGHYEFWVIVFGLSNAPTIFQVLMN